MRVSRREFIGMSGAAALGAGIQPAFETNLIALKVPNLAAQFDGYRIGYISDIHLGPWMTDQVVIDAFTSLNQHKIDLMVLGGDYILIPDSLAKLVFGDWRNDSFGDLRERGLAEEIFRRLAIYATASIPRDGVVAVYGNHDRWAHPHACHNYFTSAGIRILANERIEIKRENALLSIVGIEDFLTGVPHWPDKHEASIVLAHNPDGISDLLSRGEGKFDVALCGHTHGGQVRAPLIGAIWSHVYDRRFIEGLVQVGPTQVFTSRGLGVVGIPYRLDCPAEVNVFELKPA